MQEKGNQIDATSIHAKMSLCLFYQGVKEGTKLLSSLSKVRSKATVRQTTQVVTWGLRLPLGLELDHDTACHVKCAHPCCLNKSSYWNSASAFVSDITSWQTSSIFNQWEFSKVKITYCSDTQSFVYNSNARERLKCSCRECDIMYKTSPVFSI